MADKRPLYTLDPVGRPVSWDASLQPLVDGLRVQQLAARNQALRHANALDHWARADHGERGQELRAAADFIRLQCVQGVTPLDDQAVAHVISEQGDPPEDGTALHRWVLRLAHALQRAVFKAPSCSGNCNQGRRACECSAATPALTDRADTTELLKAFEALEEAASAVCSARSFHSTGVAVQALHKELTRSRGAINDARIAPVAEAQALRAEVERLNAIINTPQADDFLRAVSTEAEHQRQRWGSKHDDGKTPADWFWLVGYLAGKALHSHAAGNVEKAEHHIITTAAACANWHRAMFGKTDMRPGIESPAALKESQR